MSEQIIKPCEELKEYVSHFWTACSDDNITSGSSIYYATANSLTELVFGFAGKEKFFSSVRGHTINHSQFKTGGVQELFGVALYSHAVPFLFHVPASALSNFHLSPETLLGVDGQLLNEQIALSKDTHERVQILTSYFKSQLHKQKFGDLLVSKATGLIRQHGGNLQITALANQFSLSQKQFERRFKEYAGFNPKLYSRIIRFENSLQHRAKYNNLTDAAYAFGYYDQAHFINDFKKFSGYSPNSFLSLSGY